MSDPYSGWGPKKPAPEPPKPAPAKPGRKPKPAVEPTPVEEQGA